MPLSSSSLYPVAEMYQPPTQTKMGSFTILVFFLTFFFLGYLLPLLDLFRGHELPLLGLFLGSLLFLDLLQGMDTISKSVGGVEVVRDPLTPDQADDDAAADYEREDETVHWVPRRSPASDCGASIGVVEEIEGEELGD